MKLSDLVNNQVDFLNSSSERMIKSSVLNIDSESILLATSPNIYLYSNGEVKGVWGRETHKGFINPESKAWKVIQKAKKV